jgi:hypothetical protein
MNLGDDNDDDDERQADDWTTRYNRMMDSASGLAPGRTTTTTRLEEDNLLSALPSSSQTTTTTTTTCSKEEEEFDDTAWSIYSNTFFLSGGIFYLLATSWDYALFHSDRSLSIDDALTTPQRVLYEWLWFMGPLTYLLNSVIDVRWAMKVWGRDGRRRELEKLLLGKSGRSGQTTEKENEKEKTNKNAMTRWMESNDHDAGMVERGEMEIVRYHHDGLSSPLFDVVEASPLSATTTTTPKRRKLHLRRMIVSPTRKIFHRMRKHMGHRRDLMAAVTFGIAAALSVAGAICYLVSTQGEFSFVIHSSRDGYHLRIDEDVLAAWAGGLERGSIHMYLVSAVFALWRNPCRTNGGGCGGGGGTGGRVQYNGNPKSSSSWIQTWIVRPFNDVDAMETVGDVFFGVASVVDVILEDSTLDDNVLWWPIVSAVLWTFDSLFYLRGDFVTLFTKKEVLSSDEDGENVQMGSGFVGLENGEDGGVVEEDESVVQVWEYPAEGNGTENMVLS